MCCNQLRFKPCLIAVCLLTGCIAAPPTSADIFEWEYIDPLQPELGKQESTTLVPDGAGVDAVPGADLSGKDLTKAYVIGTDLSEVSFTNAILTDADFTGAFLNYTSFSDTTDSGFTEQQLASTASYQSGNLRNTVLRQNDLSGWDLSSQDLRWASFQNSDLSGANLNGSWVSLAYLSGADLSDATVNGTSFYRNNISQQQLASTMSYKTGDLSGIGLNDFNLSGWDLSGMNLSEAYLRSADFSGADLSSTVLTGARFPEAILTNTDFTNAVVAGASLGDTVDTGFTEQQLASTASYQAKQLHGIGITGDLSGWDFSGQDLTGAGFYQADLRGAKFQGAVLRDVYLEGADLSGVDLSGIDLMRADLGSVNLSGADLSDTDLTDADFSYATLAGADMTGANIGGANFRDTTSRGFTIQQLVQTASYQAGDLSGINLSRNDLSGGDMSDQNLSGADLAVTVLVAADFSNANLTGASFGSSDLTNAIMTNAVISNAAFGGSNLSIQQLRDTLSYKSADLSGVNLNSVDLSGLDLAGFNLTGAGLSANLTGVDLTDAVVTGANFSGATGLVESQFARTLSYQQHDLSGIGFGSFDLSGWDFSGQNFTDASFSFGVLVNTDLTDADLSTVGLGRGVNFRGADARGGQLPLALSQYSWLNDTRNLVLPNGSIPDGLDVRSGESMWIRDDDGNGLRGPIPITVHTAFDIDSTSTLRFLFEDADWGSTILFDPTVGTANLGGTLELAMKLDDGLTPADLLGAAFKLFDWTGVSIVGDFDAFVLDPAWYAAGLSIDRSQLMTTGEVRVVPLIGDLDGDGFVGIADLNIVLMRWNQSVTPGDLLAGDVDGDGFVGIVDLNLVLGTWNAAVPPVVGIGDVVPEPGAAVLLVLSGPVVLRRRTG